MAYEQKTKPTAGDVGEFISQIEDEGRRSDAAVLVRLMKKISGKKPKLWGSIIGFGQYHYKYPTGHEADTYLVGFSPRKREFSIHLMGAYFPGQEARREQLMARLGKHRMGKACLYVKRLSDIDTDVLSELVEMSVASLQERYPSTSGARA